MKNPIRLPGTAVRPLEGRRVLVTRPEEQAEELSQLLRELGAEPVEIPTIRILPPADSRPLDGALRRLDDFDWVIFTSPNGARAVAERLHLLGLGPGALHDCSLAAVGPVTAAVLEEHGLQPRFVPPRYLTEAIVGGLGELHGRAVLLPRTQIAPPELKAALEARGARVEQVVAYHTMPALESARRLEQALEAGLDVITLTSGSTVQSLARILEGVGRHAPPERVLLACIGPVTARAAREAGWPVGVVAEEHTGRGLARALAAHFSTQGVGP